MSTPGVGVGDGSSIDIVDVAVGEAVSTVVDVLSTVGVAVGSGVALSSDAALVGGGSVVPRSSVGVSGGGSVVIVGVSSVGVGVGVTSCASAVDRPESSATHRRISSMTADEIGCLWRGCMSFIRKPLG